MTFLEFLDRYVLERDLQQNSEQQLRYSVQHFMAFVGSDVTIESIHTDQINRYLKHLQSMGRAYDTIRTRRTNLLVLINEAYRQQLTDQDSRRIRRLTPKRPKIEAWTPSQVRQLFDIAQSWIGQRELPGGICEGLYWSAYVCAAWDSGLRHGDLLGLPMGDIQERFWIDQHKTANPVLVEFRESTVARIKRLQKSGPPRLCPFAWPLKRRAFFRHASILIKQAGLKGTMKFLRRGCGTAVAAASQNVADASRKLGHTSEAITRRHYLAPEWQQFPSTLPPSLEGENPPHRQPNPIGGADDSGLDENR